MVLLLIVIYHLCRLWVQSGSTAAAVDSNCFNMPGTLAPDLDYTGQVYKSLKKNKQFLSGNRLY